MAAWALQVTATSMLSGGGGTVDGSSNAAFAGGGKTANTTSALGAAASWPDEYVHQFRCRLEAAEAKAERLAQEVVLMEREMQACGQLPGSISMDC
mmetsp:Transcript_35637/g.70473  ORF Transcript_35637/g.70473 Transcript_35637/m.70473 type:complete len:96 (+) Transcript_35637:146-433(+)